ncbi:CynX/NimT family MFS transporter [Vagococcus intermedius]|uniref:MFS transporter n=1 Tax=Vagococcus intermedius TaxID=2991418 RepID=A0AAF0CT59_9ENTE|nr:MFS transporter [Vagococcus intermedius]WEG72453.1 MFS transporter [Vagococcus intermedius]WEG74540.1 MFS transporter [Vagococcus intermedius]
MKERTTRQSIILLIGIVLIATNLRAPLTSVGPLIENISQSYQLNSTTAGMVATTPLLAFALVSILAPLNARKFGIERTLLMAMFVLSIGLVIRSLPGVINLFVGTALVGISIAHGNVLVPSLIKRDFPDKLGMMTGIYSVAMNLAGAIASGISLPLVNKWGVTWQTSLNIWVVMSVLALLAWIPQVKDKTTVKIVSEIKDKTNMWQSHLAWKISAFMGLQSLVFYSLLAWIPQILSEKGISGETSGMLLALMQIFIVPFNFLVSILAGRVADQRRLVIWGVCLMFLGLVGITLADGIVINAISLSLIGISGGFTFSLSMMFFSLRTKNAVDAAQISGMAQSIGYLLAAAGPLLFGLLHDLSGTWLTPMWSLWLLAGVLLWTGLGAGKIGIIGENN